MQRLFASSEPLDVNVHRILRCDEHLAEPIVERVLPDGALHLIFDFGEPVRDSVSCLVKGPTCLPNDIVLAGAVEQLCVRLRIGDAAAVLGLPAGELTDQRISLRDLWGATTCEWLEKLHGIPHGAARSKCLQNLIEARAARNAGADSRKAPSALVFEAVRRIAKGGGLLSTRELSTSLGVGERRLQQLFHAYVGLSPKAFSRLARFRAVFRRCVEPTQSWVDIALAAGFYDQSHLVNELRVFTGFTPGELARRGDFGFFQEGEVAER